MPFSAFRLLGSEVVVTFSLSSGDFENGNRWIAEWRKVFTEIGELQTYTTLLHLVSQTTKTLTDLDFPDIAVARN